MMAGRSRLILAAVGSIFVVGYAVLASQLRTPAFSDPMGPRAVPYLIAAGLGLSCIALLFEHVIVQTRRNADVSSTETRNADGGLTGTAVLTLCLLTGYYLLLERLGFILSTGLFLLAFLSFTNHRRWLVNLAVATLFPIAAYVLLATLLGARLPVGILAMG
ncbi:hypothetical protein ADU59_21500 [Pararhizobium polonicum]|uniref:DUF1468 domain-containing protein n=2 Tax=Pararhizobium polonicum TaxID=1612624 RepID=A0A1C7NWQ1_9HYPH|nr:hypothetical protein ADU59_21500 [Pararhizobium polonicum]